MAFERLSDRKVIGTNLNAFIQTNLALLKNQRTTRNMEDETKFQTSVLEDNLSLNDQLSYRTDQLARVKGDKDETKRIRTEIAALKDRIEAQKFSDEYTQRVDELNTGAASIDATIDWVTNRLKVTTDLNIKNSLQQSLSQLTQKKFQLQQSTLDTQSTYAVNNKSEDILTTQLERVGSARKTALLAGNDNYVAVLDIQLQNLTKALTETRVSNTLLSLATDTITGQSATAMLDKFNSMVSTADTSTPVTIGGVRYNNAQEFWNSKRADYLNDNSDNGFFGRFNNEIAKNVTYQVSKGIFGNGSLKQVADSWDGLTTRPELKDYSTNLNQSKQAALQSAADIRATQVINQFTTDLDAGKAVGELSTIQKTYGVDQTKSFQTIILKASQEKEAQLQSLLAATSKIATDTGVSFEQAFQQAAQSGVATSSTFSPEALATTPTTELGKTAITSTNKGPNLNVDPKIAADIKAPKLTDGGIYKLNNSPTSYLYQNGQLQPLADKFTPEEFKKATGKSFDQIETVTDFGSTPIGAPLNKTQLITSGPQPIQNAPAPAPAAAPANAPAPAGAAPAGLQVKAVTDLVGRRPSASNPKAYEYFRQDTKQGFSQGKDLFDYLGANGYTGLNDFKKIDPLFS